MLTIRVEPDVKARIVQAAATSGWSLSTFVVDAALHAAKRVEEKAGAALRIKRFRGVPAFFRALCSTASAGGDFGYDTAGYELARHTAALMPNDADPADWDDRLASLRNAVRDEDHTEIRIWYLANFPQCMELVPFRRLRRFTEGVVRFNDEEGL